MNYPEVPKGLMIYYNSRNVMTVSIIMHNMIQYDIENHSHHHNHTVNVVALSLQCTEITTLTGKSRCVSTRGNKPWQCSVHVIS